MSKPKVAFYWCASCGGCEESVVDLAENILKVAKIVSGKQKDFIDVGSMVTVKNGGKITWTIVGSEESDLETNKISNESPLGSLLMGKREGEKVELVTPKGKTVYTILKLTKMLIRSVFMFFLRKLVNGCRRNKRLPKRNTRYLKLKMFFRESTQPHRV